MLQRPPFTLHSLTHMRSLTCSSRLVSPQDLPGDVTQNFNEVLRMFDRLVRKPSEAASTRRQGRHALGAVCRGDACLCYATGVFCIRLIPPDATGSPLRPFCLSLCFSRRRETCPRPRSPAHLPSAFRCPQDIYNADLNPTKLKGIAGKVLGAEDILGQEHPNV